MRIIIDSIGNYTGLTSVIGKEVEATAVVNEDVIGEDGVCYNVASEELMRVGKPFRVKHVVEGVPYIVFDGSQVTVLVEEPLPTPQVDESLAAMYRRHAAYNSENTVMKAIRLNRKTDADILAYLDGKKFQPVVKEALRKLISEEAANA